MHTYTDLTMTCSGSSNRMIAGFDTVYHKAMLLSDNTMNQLINGPPVTVVEPLAGPWHGRSVNVKETASRVLAPVAIASFYYEQRPRIKYDPLCVVDVQEEQTEITTVLMQEFLHSTCISHGMVDLVTGIEEHYLAQVGGIDDYAGTIHQAACETLRRLLYTTGTPTEIDEKKVLFKGEYHDLFLDFHYFRQLLDGLTREIIAGVNELLEFSRVVVDFVVCSGRLFADRTLVSQLEAAVLYPVLSYKPEDAAVLGGCMYVHRQFKEKSIFKGTAKEPPFRYGAGTSLNDGEQAYYKAFLQAFESRKQKFFTHQEIQKESAEKAAISFFLDYPEAELLYEKEFVSTIWEGGFTKHAFEMQAYDEQILHALETTADEIFTQCIKGRIFTDDELVRRVYGYVRNHYRYSQEDYDGFPGRCFTVQTLLEPDGVCQGFACVLVYLFRRLQIPVFHVEGHSTRRRFPARHRWNMVQSITTGWSHYDVTFDLAFPGRSHFFALPDGEMKSQYHVWEEQNYPSCRKEQK